MGNEFYSLQMLLARYSQTIAYGDRIKLAITAAQIRTENNQ